GLALVVRPKHAPVAVSVTHPAPAPAAPAAPPPRLPAAPDPQVGIVKIDTAPAGAALYLDGVKLPSLSPATVDRIDAGKEHVLLVQLDGHRDTLQKFTLHAAEVQTLSLKLSRDHKTVAAHARPHDDVKLKPAA